MRRETGVGQYLVTLGSVSKLGRFAPVPLPAGTRPGSAREFEIAFATFEQIRVAFPELAMTLDLHHPHAEYMTINLPVSVGFRNVARERAVKSKARLRSCNELQGPETLRPQSVWASP